MDPYRHKDPASISKPRIASAPQGMRAATVPNRESTIYKMNFSPIIWSLDTGMVIMFLLHFELASLVMLTKTAVVAHGGATIKSMLGSSKNERPNPSAIRLTIVTRILLLAMYRSLIRSPLIVFPPLRREA